MRLYLSPAVPPWLLMQGRRRVAGCFGFGMEVIEDIHRSMSQVQPLSE